MAYNDLEWKCRRSNVWVRCLSQLCRRTNTSVKCNFSVRLNYMMYSIYTQPPKNEWNQISYPNIHRICIWIVGVLDIEFELAHNRHTFMFRRPTNWIKSSSRHHRGASATTPRYWLSSFIYCEFASRLRRRLCRRGALIRIALALSVWQIIGL